MAIHDGEDVLGALLMRESLDHCVKCTICETFCPVSNVTPLFPGPKYAGPQAERFRVDGRAVARRVGQLLLGLRDLHPGLPAGRPHRRDQHAGQGRSTATRTACPLRDRILARPTLAGRLGTPAAPIANWSLRNRLLRTAAERVIGIHRDAPMPKFAGPHVPALGEEAHPARPAAARRLLPRLRHELLRAAAGRDDGRAARAQRHRRRGAQAGLLRAAAAVQRPVRRRARLRRTGSRKRLAPYARDGVDIVGTSTSCTLMLKREALEILGMGDDAELQAVSGRVFDICEYLLAMHERGELKTDFAPVPETVVYHAPCQQQGHGIGKPALDLLRARARAAGGREHGELLRRRRHLRAQAREVRHRDAGRAPLFRQIAGDRPRPRRVRLRDVPLADRARDRRAHRASGRGAPPRVRPRLSSRDRGRPRHRLPQRGARRRRRRARARDGRRGRRRSPRRAAWTTARSGRTPSGC